MKGLKTSTICLSCICLISCLACQDKESDNRSDPQEGFVQLASGKVWYRLSGPNASGIPLIVVHGGPGASHFYLENLERHAVDRPVLLYDQLGCGHSDRPADTAYFTTEYFVEELEAIRKHFNFNEFHLMGQSWGAFLALSYLGRYGDDGLKSLTLSGPLISSDLWLNDQQFWIDQLPFEVKDTIRKYEASGDFASAAYLEAMDFFYRRHLCRLDPWPPALLATFDNMGAEVYRYMWGPSEFTLTGTLKGADVSPVLKNITKPCLITCGEFDEARPETMEIFSAMMLNSRLIVYPNASHAHHLEAESDYLNDLRNFLKEND